MGDMLVKGISDAMQRSLAERADKSGRSLSDEIKDILQRELSEPDLAADAPSVSGWDILRPIMMSDNQHEADVYVEIMNEIEAERRVDFGRPAESLE